MAVSGSRLSLTLKRCALCLTTGRRIAFITERNVHSTTVDEDTSDIVVSGGGMVGGAMTCVLGQDEKLSHKKVVMLESSTKKDWSLPEKYSNRTCALSPASVSLFQSFGAWDDILQMRCQPVKKMQVWDSCSESLITFNYNDLLNDLAYIVENDVIQEAIKRKLEQLPANVQIKYGTHVTSYSIPGVSEDTGENSWVTLQLSDGSKLRTKLLIGADGMNSSVRSAAKFHVVKRNYKQSALVATLELSGEMENNVAWQRFLPTGPIAMLPLSDKYSNLIWSTTPEMASHLKSLPADSFVDAVNDAFWHNRDSSQLAITIGRTFQKVTSAFSNEELVYQLPPAIVGVEEKSRASFPLSLVHSSNYSCQRVALIGDAAHRIHPLAGQGVNLGFGDVSCLAELLSECVHNGGDVGSLNHLKKYETQRQRAVLPVVATIDGLQRLYSTDLAPVVLIRSLGLQAVNSMPFLKNYIIGKASV